MSNSDNNNKSTDIGKGAIDNSVNAGKKGMGLLRGAKKLGKFAKVLKSILSKVLGSCIKWLLGLLGPYVILAIVLIVLLMIVLDSVVSFDLFQKASSRTDTEVVFDNAVKEVFELRLEAGPAEIRDRLRSTQSEFPYPPVSEPWLYQVGDLLKQSIAIPTIHHYFRNIEHENYKAWHEQYKDYTADNMDNLLGKFIKIIDKEMAYYFEGSPNYKPIFVNGTSPIDEYVDITTTTTCTYTDDEGNTTVTVSGPTTTHEKVSHEIITEVQLGYLKATIPYKVEHKIVDSTSSSGNCVSDITTETNLYIIDDGSPPAIELLAEELVKILVSTSEEGEHTKLVQVQDLEYSIDLGQEIDERFPKPDIDYEGLKKCYFKNKSIEPCIGEFVLGGSLGDYDLASGWYPSEYESIYKAAADHCGIDWFILAAVHGQETSFSSNPVATDPTKGSMNSDGEYIGALGHFQFMPLTWVGWAARNDFPTSSKGNIYGDISFITVPANIKKYGGRGKDGNGDGVASPWDLTDAAYAAACYIKSIGYQKGNTTSIKTALAKYNGGNIAWQSGSAQKYADEVYNNGKQFELGVDSPISVAPGEITYPTTGSITSPYGSRWGAFHYGVDIGANGRSNVPIVSVADGVVSYVGPLSTYGNIVRVQHNIDGFVFETLYAHLATYKVKKGQTVKKGQQIAIMGNTGNSTGPHLHFEIHVPKFVKQATNPRNPMQYIPTPPLK
ncbi:peptidoglycan DD-metalloendopeptidase family protein [Lysinibacillus sp. UGB7]|uniref:peptidoglycan DD-metalloendopeptidase family protein n=1 Tax=Lysinibacillus sp. UGB7 TaxID=3411039 RepID=UPI003B7B654B